MNTYIKRLQAIITIIILIVLVYSIWIFAQASNNLVTSSVFDHITLTWTGNPETTMTITWRADSKTKNGFVQYQKGINFTNSAESVKATSAVFTTELGSSNLFTATLTNLSPNMKYIYRVGNGKSWSDTYTFSTSDMKVSKFKFLVFGDSQSMATGKSPYGLWNKTIHNAYKANPDAKFAVNVGDLVDIGQSGAHWNAWFSSAAGVIDSIPVMPVVGNHETMGIPYMRKPTFWNAQFHLPQNGPPGLKNQVYSYNYGLAHFVVLDSQKNEEIKYGNIFTPQKEWLDKDLKSTKAIWKIVFFHKAPYSLLVDRDNIEIKTAFCPIIEKYHTDIVFNGHDHGVARTYPIKNDHLMAKPSEGTIYYVAGRSGSKTYDDIIKRTWNTFFYNPIDQPNYLVVQVDDTQLTVKTVKQDGTTVNTFFIDTNKDISSDSIK